MSRYSKRRTGKDIESLGGLVVVVLILIALKKGGISGFAHVLYGLLAVVVILAVAAGAIYLIARSSFCVWKKIGSSLIILALLTGGYWKVSTDPLKWPEIKATVMSPIRADSQTLRVNVGNLLVPNIIELRIPNPETYKTGTQLSLWENPVTHNEYSLIPRTTEQHRDPFLLVIACLACAVGIGLFFVRRQEPVENGSISERTPSDGAGASAKVAEVSALADPSPGIFAETLPEKPDVPDIAVQLDSIDWFQFEKVVKRIMEWQGWQVEHTGGEHADGGVDLIATKSNTKVVVQCKYWSHPSVDVKVVRELNGAKNSLQFQADGAMLFTTGRCTVPTLEFAEENRIEVFGFEWIRGNIAAIGIEKFPELMHPEIKFCPKCGAPMIWRTNAKTPFWGCSDYPKTHCHGKILKS